MGNEILFLSGQSFITMENRESFIGKLQQFVLRSQCFISETETAVLSHRLVGAKDQAVSGKKNKASVCANSLQVVHVDAVFFPL